jgi:hypothetical protein
MAHAASALRWLAVVDVSLGAALRYIRKHPALAGKAE